jgi:hypothetical protein
MLPLVLLPSPSPSIFQPNGKARRSFVRFVSFCLYGCMLFIGPTFFAYAHPPIRSARQLGWKECECARGPTKCAAVIPTRFFFLPAIIVFIKVLQGSFDAKNFCSFSPRTVKLMFGACSATCDALVIHALFLL